MSSKATQPTQEQKEEESTFYPVTTTAEYGGNSLCLFQLVHLNRSSTEGVEDWIVTSLDKQIVLSTPDFEDETTILDIEMLEIGFKPVTTANGVPILAY